MLTSNKGFEKWGGALGDEVKAAALIDRLLHNCHIVNIRGNGFRVREHRDRLGKAGPDRNAQQGNADTESEEAARVAGLEAATETCHPLAQHTKGMAAPSLRI